MPRMCMRNPADLTKCSIENQMSRQVGGRPQDSFLDFAVQPNDDEISRLHRFIRNAARLDDNSSRMASASVSGILSESSS